MYVFKYTWFHIWKKKLIKETPYTWIEDGVFPLASGGINFTVLDQPSKRLAPHPTQARSVFVTGQLKVLKECIDRSLHLGVLCGLLDNLAQVKECFEDTTRDP